MTLFLIDDILLAPVKMTVWLAEQIKGQMDAEIHDVAKIKEVLARLQEQYDMGRISEKEFREKEDHWLGRLEAARKFHESSGPRPGSGRP